MKRKQIVSLFIVMIISLVFCVGAFAAETQPTIADSNDTQTNQTQQVTTNQQSSQQSSETKKTPSIEYQAHVQNIGDQAKVKNNGVAGTIGKSLRVEGLRIWLNNAENSSIKYRAHVQNIGWQNPVMDGKLSGTSGKKLRIEALQIKLDGDISKQYDVYYSVHVQNFGWLGWAKDGQTAGTEGLSLRIEAIQIKLVKKNEAVPSNSDRDSHASLTKDLFKQNVSVNYQTHVQNIGWQQPVKNGAIAGTTGRSLRVEAYRVAVNDKLANNTYITYHSHIQNIGNKQGWVNSKNTKAYSGTTGQSKRVEAIQMNLNGYAANAMDVWYRVHSQHYGWLGWAKNGEWAGTSNSSKRVEAIQIVLRTKNEGAPGSTARHYIKMNNTIENKIVSLLPKNQKWSVYAEQLTGDRNIIDINGSQSMQTASCAKLFIMATIYNRGIKSNERPLVQKMITQSDNNASNTLLSHLGNGNAKNGLSVVNNWCRQNGYSQTSMGRLFLEKNPKGDNISSARDISNLLKSIKQGTCVNAQASNEMLGYLRGQKYTEKIPAGIRESGKRKTTGNKTGEISLGQGRGCIENDAALIYDDKSAYTLVVLSNDLNGDNPAAQQRIVDIAKTVATSWP